MPGKYEFRKSNMDEISNLSESVDLTKIYDFPPVFDQGQLGSAAACGIAGAVLFRPKYKRTDRPWLSYSEWERTYGK